MPPTVSVVIPAFNRAAIIRRAIDSVLGQTFQDFEIIVVDDCSTDGTADVVGALRDPRIVVIRHERNRGGGAARNSGIEASSAPYVAFLDSDDEWLPTKLERQLELFERGSERLALVYTGAEWVFADGTVKWRIPNREADLARALLTENVVGETSVGLVRRSALNEIGGFDETLPSCQDMDLWLRICEQFEAALIPDTLVRVAKGDDRGRITNSAASSVHGRVLFCQKHREKLTRYGVLHVHLRKTGWWYQRRLGDCGAARRLHLEAIGAKPMALTTYVLLVAACVPLPVVEMMARGKRSVAAVLRLEPDASYLTRPPAKLRGQTPSDSAVS